jgi:IS30 family transposase
MMLVRPTTPAAGEGDAGGTSWDRAHPGGNLWRWGFTRGGSPAQIAGRRRKMNPEDASRRVCHETIHAALYAFGELRKALWEPLRRGHQSRRPRRQGQDRRGGLVNMTSIHERPAEVMGREVPGHWEGDLIKGAGNHGAVGTLVERKSRYVVMSRMRDTGAEAAREGFTRRFRPGPACVRKTPTHDQGKAMARHEELARRPRIKVYFADPRSPWQRPSNENAHGPIREYLPKGRDLSGVSQAELNPIARLLNNRPRQCLDFATPAEIFQRDFFNSQCCVALQA